jgi:hypothetical protein
VTKSPTAVTATVRVHLTVNAQAATRRPHSTEILT